MKQGPAEHDPSDMTRKNVGMPKALWAEIAEYRFHNHVGSEAEAVRRLVVLGLDAARLNASKKDKAR